MCHDCADIWIAYSWSPENRLLYQVVANLSSEELEKLLK